MALHVALTHRTEYVYDRPTALGPQVVRLRPAPHSRTPILSYSLNITPKEHFINWQQDPFGNYLARLVFPEETREFKVVVDLVADMATINPFDFFVDEYARDFPFEYDAELKEELAPYLKASEPGPLLKDYLSKLRFDVKTSIDFIWALNGQLQHDVKYLIRLEPGVQTPEETLRKKSGSCRDSAWLLVHILRNYGLAARFVSGYLIQLKADVKSLDGPSGTEQDFTDLHAWAEVYLPGAGWIGLDPTSGLFAGEGHIPLAATPSPQSAAPITGMHEEAEVEFSHHMKVTRILESPRVTLPYTDEQWSAIATAGHEVDRRLEEGDVRLSMGGEPTFVSIDDVDGAEWNTDAVGPYQAPLCRKSHPAPARPVRAGRPPALRTRQMVSGRAAAALGVRGLLASGWAAAMGGRAPHRQRGSGRERRPSTTQGVSRRRSPSSSACPPTARCPPMKTRRTSS